MSNTLFIEIEKRMPAHISVVWAALTDPDITPLYLYGCKIIMEKNQGGSIKWIGKSDHVTYMSGHIIDFEETACLAYTTSQEKNTPALTLRFQLEAINNESCMLRFSYGDFQLLDSGRQKYQEAIDNNSWHEVLETLQTILQHTDDELSF